MKTQGPLRRRLPPETLSRLPAYRKQLRILDDEGQEVVSSKDLAFRLHISDAQLRRDLSYMALLGRRGLGYEVHGLLEATSSALGLDRHWGVAVVGGGSLGTAIARYRGFVSSNMEVLAIFDVDARKVGKKIGKLPVLDLAELPARARELGIDIAVLTVPAEAAQAAADVIVRAGITGMINFSPTFVQVPPEVRVRSVDITSEFQQLTHQMEHRALPL